ncbi:hypothetical protein GCM10027271_57150 [Saccharopolyspora gloriosae]
MTRRYTDAGITASTRKVSTTVTPSTVADHAASWDDATATGRLPVRGAARNVLATARGEGVRTCG